MKYLFQIIGVLIITIVGGCASSVTPPNNRAPGFLMDYSQLKPLANPTKGQHIYIYTAPDAKRSNYHAVIVDPVLLYQTATESGITEEQIKKAKININEGVNKIVSGILPITTTPGPGVARFQVAITGAMLEGDGFKPRYVIPVSAIIKLTTMAVGLDNKTPVLMVETKTTDSISGKLLRSTVTIIRGEKFRMDVHTPEEFVAAAKIWVDQAITYANAPEKLKAEEKTKN